MKKLTTVMSVLAIFAFTMCLAACGGNESSQKETQTTEKMETAIDDIVSINMPEDCSLTESSDPAIDRWYEDPSGDTINISLEWEDFDMTTLLKPEDLEERIHQGKTEDTVTTSYVSPNGMKYIVVTDPIQPNCIDAYAAVRDSVICVEFATGDNEAYTKEQEKMFYNILDGIAQAAV